MYRKVGWLPVASTQCRPLDQRQASDYSQGRKPGQKNAGLAAGSAAKRIVGSASPWGGQLSVRGERETGPAERDLPPCWWARRGWNGTDLVARPSVSA